MDDDYSGSDFDDDVVIIPDIPAKIDKIGGDSLLDIVEMDDEDVGDDVDIDVGLDDAPDEVEIQSGIIKEIIVIANERRTTSNIMNLYEMTEYVSIRCEQIAKYNNCMVDTSGLTDTISMAKRELMMRECPLTLRRHVGDRVSKTGIVTSYYEYWDPAQMIFAISYDDVLI